MPFTLEKKIAAGFAAAVGFMLMIGAAAWWSAVRSAETFRLVDHTHEVLYQLESSLTDILNMQTATRGYLLTGERHFLEPHTAGTIRIEQAARSLRTLTADDPAQRERLTRLKSHLDQAAAVMRELIARREAGGSPAEATDPLVAGKANMDRIRLLIAEMEAEGRRLLAVRSAAARTGQRRAALIFGLGSLAATALVAAAGLTVRRDFAQRVKAEQERDRFFSLSLDLLCIAHAADGRFKRVSPAVCDILGWTPEEFLARPYMAQIHPDDRTASQREVDRQVIGGEKVLQFENRFQHKDGSWRVLSWRSVPQPGGLMYAIARDVTEQKRLDAQIRQLNTDLQQRATLLEATNRELEAFSYSVSHDLRAPLRHIDGFASLLQKNAAAVLDDQGRRHLATISGSARQMGRLIDDLLAFSRMGRATLQPREIADHGALVATVIREGRWDRADRPVAWQIDPLPAVRADPAMLQQVWANLLDNAVKYSGKVAAPRIEVGARPDPAAGELVFFVRDNGAGFDMRYVDKIFDVFQRLHGPAEFEGTGIGLANVRRIILRHGGRTWAEGAPGRGATFYFSLPPGPIPVPA